MEFYYSNSKVTHIIFKNKIVSKLLIWSKHWDKLWVWCLNETFPVFQSSSLKPFPLFFFFAKFFCITVTNNHYGFALGFFPSEWWQNLSLMLYLVFHFQSALQSFASWAPLPMKFISWWHKEEVLGIWLCPLLLPQSKEEISAVDWREGEGVRIFVSNFWLCTWFLHILV